MRFKIQDAGKDLGKVEIHLPQIGFKDAFLQDSRFMIPKEYFYSLNLKTLNNATVVVGFSISFLWCSFSFCFAFFFGGGGGEGVVTTYTCIYIYIGIFMYTYIHTDNVICVSVSSGMPHPIKNFQTFKLPDACADKTKPSTMMGCVSRVHRT